MGNCIHCGSKKGWTDLNYAGRDLVVDVEHFPFPSRIKPQKLPGKTSEFLCSSCAGKVAVMCKVHGNFNKDGFNYGGQPKCNGCEMQYESIKEDKLPLRFEWLLPVTYIEEQGVTYKQGWAALSVDKELHVIAEGRKFAISGKIDSFTPELALINTYSSLPGLFLKATCNGRKLKVLIDFSDATLMNKISNMSSVAGTPWLDFWAESIKEKLGLQYENLADLRIISLTTTTLSDFSFSANSQEQKVIFCSFKGTQAIFYPPLDIPDLRTVKFWKTDGLHRRALLLFEKDDVPYVLNFRELYSLRGDDLQKVFSANLEKSKELQDVQKYDLNNKAIIELKLLPSSRKKKAIIELEQSKRLKVTLLPEQDIITVSYGYEHNGTFLGFGEHPTVFVSEISSNILRNISFSDSSLINQFSEDSTEASHSIYLLSNDSTAEAYSLEVSTSFWSLNGVIRDYSKDVRLKVKPLGGDDKKCEVVFEYDENGWSQSTVCVAPEALSYELLKRWDKIRSSTLAKGQDISTLYKEFNHYRRNDLLFLLFADLFVLEHQLNAGVPMEELFNNLIETDDESFFANEKLLKSTTEKIFLLSEEILNQKKKMAYLALYYPYFVMKSESDWLKGLFGAPVATSVIKNEREQITSTYRNRVKSIRTEIMGEFVEIEKALGPAIKAIDVENIKRKSSTSTNIKKASQLAGLATIAVLSCGFSLLLTGGQLVDNVTHFVAKDKNAALKVKKAFEDFYPWWILFEESRAVIVYETNQFVENERVRFMKRDKALLQKVPNSERQKYIENLFEKIQEKIFEDKHRDREEVLEGSGITKSMIADKIEMAMSARMYSSVDIFINSLRAVS